MSRLTRQEMKRDEVREWMVGVYEWLYDHLRLIIQIAVGVLILGVAGVLVWSWMQNRDNRARQALADAMEIYQAPVVEAAEAQPDDEDAPSFASEEARRTRARELFDVVHDSWSSSESARIASVYLGRIAQEEGDLERARELWSSYVEARETSALTGMVYLNLWSLDRQQGRQEQVEQEIRAQLDATSARLPEDTLLYELGVTLEDQGKTEEAREIFERLVEDHPTSPYTTDSRQRLDVS